MKTLKRVLYVDVIGQSIIFLPMLVCFFFALITFDFEKFVPAIAFGQFFLGIWQLLSAIILAIAWKDKWRIRYLKLVLLWFTSMLLGSFLFATVSLSQTNTGQQLDSGVYYFLMFCIPNIMAFYYYQYSIKQWRQVKNRPVSFWELV